MIDKQRNLLDEYGRKVLTVEVDELFLQSLSAAVRLGLLLFEFEPFFTFYSELGKDWIQDGPDAQDRNQGVDQRIDQDYWAYIQVFSALESKCVGHGSSQA